MICLFDVEEKEFIKLCDEGKVIDLHSAKHENKSSDYETLFSYYVVADKKFENEVFEARIEINILEKQV